MLSHFVCESLFINVLKYNSFLSTLNFAKFVVRPFFYSVSEKLWLYVLGISNVHVQYCNSVLWLMLVRPLQ